jgi:hypothetical protein
VFRTTPDPRDEDGGVDCAALERLVATIAPN